MNLRKAKFETNKKFLGLAIIFAIVVLLIVRALYGFDNVDEAFYLAMMDRIWKGDALIVEEWNATQFFFCLFVPAYHLYKLCFNDIIGIYLFFRVLAIIVSTMVAIFTYYTLRLASTNRAAIIASVLVLLYCRGNIPGIKYYDIYAYLVLIICLLEIRKEHNPGKKAIYSFFQGIGFAICFTAMPYYVVIVPLVVWLLVKGKRYKELIGVVLGGAIVAGGFLIVILSRTSVSSILNSVPYLLSDEEHESGVISFLFNDLKAVVHVVSVPGCIIILIAIVLVLVFSRGKSNGKIIEYAIMLSFIGMIFDLAVRYKNANETYVILIAYSFPLVLHFWLNMHSNNKKIIGLLWIAGWIAALVFGSASNTNVQALSTGLLSSCVAVVLGIDEYVKCKKRIIIAISVIVLLVVCSFQRFMVPSKGSELKYLNSRANIGPLKGLYLEEKEREGYENAYTAIRKIEAEYSPQRVYISGWMMWAYLDSSFKCGSNTVWAGQIYPSSRLDLYYEKNPTMIPDMVIVERLWPDPPRETQIAISECEARVGKTITQKYEETGYDVLDCNEFVAFRLRD